MLLGWDLVLLYGAVVLVVGWLMARRKWRQAARRREEIRRLMALASEEAARAELEAAATYRIYASSPAPEPVAVETVSRSSPQLLQYECEVCFRPTTTRCKQCKAVRYCSRKCQILHWRQGHRDKCHSLTTNQSIDVRVHSSVKEFEQDGSSRMATAIEEVHATKPVESSSETCIFSKPNFHDLGQNVEMETEACDNWKRTENVEELVQSVPDDSFSSTISIEMSVASDSNLKDCNYRNNGQSTSMNVESMKSPISKQPSLTNHESGFAASSVSDQLKFGRHDIDETSESSKFSGFSATGSEENSLSESSTPSSDFWAGTVEFMRSKKNAFDEFDDVDMSNNCASGSSSSNRINSHVEMFGSGMNRVVGDDPCQAKSMPMKSIALSKVSEDGLNSRERLSLSCKQPGQCGDNNTSTKCSSTEEAKLSNFDGCCRGTAQGNVLSTSVDVRSLQSSAPKKLDDKIDGTNGILDTLKCQQNDSSRLSSTESHLSSSTCTRKPAIEVVQSMENESTHVKATRSLDSNGNVQSASSQTNLSMRRIVDQLRVSDFPRHGSLSAGSGIMGRYEGSFPYELFVKLYNWNKVELSPCGLMNCGNSCYANAVLQCLAFTPPLAAYCVQGLHAKTCKKRGWCFTCEFEELVRKSKECNNPLSPARIMSQMQHIGSHLGNGREEDAHEFLRCAIDAMQSVCLKEAGVNEPSSLFEETTLLGLTFGGYLQSKIECMRCGGRSKQHERIMDLTVEIEGEIGTLEDALLQFTRTEILDGENKYQCSRCRSYEKAKKKLRVLEAPNVLVVALKRFQTGKFGKLSKAVKFPEVLNLAPYMSGTSDKSPIYQLFGVVVHIDVMNAVFSGHYVCYIKNNQGRWFKADDTVVQAAELEKVLLNDAYILFYARCSPRAPKVIRSSMAPCDPRKVKKLTSKVKSHPPEPWDVSVSDHTSNGYFHRNYKSHNLNVEEESSTSEYSSSYFSEGGSNSTESSNRESVSTIDENLDQLLCDTGTSWNRQARRSTSTSYFGTPLHTRHSHIDRCYSDAESSSCYSVNTSPSPKRRF